MPETEMAQQTGERGTKRRKNIKAWKVFLKKLPLLSERTLWTKKDYTNKRHGPTLTRLCWVKNLWLSHVQLSHQNVATIKTVGKRTQKKCVLPSITWMLSSRNSPVLLKEISKSSILSPASFSLPWDLFFCLHIFFKYSSVTCLTQCSHSEMLRSVH